LREIADYAEPRGVKIALYPHTWFWLERVDDGVRLANKLNRPGVGATFNLCHWLKVEGERDPLPMLRAALPRLFFVSINGADAGDPRKQDWNQLIQTLDQGSYDVAGFVRQLREIGYTGPVGLQCYNLKGDSKDNLTRSMAAWRKFEASPLVPSPGGGASPASNFASASFIFSRDPVALHVTDASGGAFHYDTDGRLHGQFDQPGDYRIKLSDGTDSKIAVTLPPPLAVTGPWQLSVSATQAVSPQAPLTLRLDRLVSWRELPELRHYAGTATYTTDFNVPPGFLGGDFTLFLDLGEVFELARVKINDRDAGTAWTPPFRLEVTSLVKSGRNTLRLEVPNLLKNHLEKGDTYQRPSGLLGPVKLAPVRQATLASSPEPTASAAPADFRQIEVFRSGEAGYHTYHIPVLIESRAGTLLAFCEGRKNGDSDRGDIDLLLWRSHDGGRTWSPVQPVWDDGTNTCGNPCPVVDRETGVIWLLMAWNSAQLRREEDVQAGFGEDSRRVFVTHSSDDGATWAEPVEIAASAKRPEWTWYATGWDSPSPARFRAELAAFEKWGVFGGTTLAPARRGPDGVQRDGWDEVVALVQVPEGVGHLVILLGVAQQTGAADLAEFDDVRLVRIRE
jgi:hypothetical protein